MTRRTVLTLGVFGSFLVLKGLARPFSVLGGSAMFTVRHSDEEWRRLLTPEQYAVLRQEHTEPPFANALFAHEEAGIYLCAGCQQRLFSSEHKFDSGTGWPSFWQPLSAEAVGVRTDWKLLIPRTEVHCARCGGHLGHVFKDGPPPTGLRYCINSAALSFVPA